MATLELKSVESGLRLAAPQLILAATMALSVIALPLPYAGAVRPALVLIVIYYWAINRPTLVPPWLCFGCGLALDALSGGPLGPNALTLVAAQWIVRDQRRFLMGQSYLMLWAIFVLTAALVALAQWAMFGLAQMHWTVPVLPAASVGLSLLVFPPMSVLLIAVHRLLPAASRPFP